MDNVDVRDSRPEDCAECGPSIAGYALGIVGLLVGSFFLYMAIDVLSNGAVTRILGLGNAREDA